MPSKLPFSLTSEEAKSITKIGKLRFMKSGRVILRIQEGDRSIDMDVSEGIPNQFF